MKSSEFKISMLVESYDEKTAENDRNYYVAERLIISKLSKILIPYFDGTNSRLELRLSHHFKSLSFIFSDKLTVTERYGLVGPFHRFKRFS